MTNLLSILTLLLKVLLGSALLMILLILLAGLRDVVISAVCSSFEVIAKPSIFLGHALIQVMGTLNEHIKRALIGMDYTSEHNDHDVNSWHGWNVIAPLIYLGTLVLLIYGDLYVFVLRFAALFGQPASSLPIGIDLLTGLTWAAMVGLWGYVYYDLLGATPVGRPFHNLSPKARHQFKLIAGIACLLSIASGMCFYAWGQFVIDGFSLQFLAWIFIALFALLLNGAIVVAGWSILAGSGALYVLLLMIIRIGCFIAYVTVVIEVRTIDTIAALLVWLIDIPATLGRIIWSWFVSFGIAHRSHLHPIAPFKKRPVIGPDTMLPNSRTLAAAQHEEAGPQDEQEDIAMTMTNQQRGTANLVGIGDFASTFLPQFWIALKQLNATATLRTIGVLNVKRASTTTAFLQTQSEVDVISPTQPEIVNTLNESSNMTEATLKLAHRMVDKLVEVNVARKHPLGHVVFVQDIASDRGVFEKNLHELKMRLPQQRILVLTTLPRIAPSESQMLEVYTTLLQLCHDGTTAGVILLNARSEGYARAYGEEQQEQCASIALASLLMAHTHSERNQSYVEVIEYLGRHAPFFSMAFARRCFAGGAASNGGLLRRPAKNFPSHGLGKLHDMLIQAKDATEQVLGDRTARAIDEPIDVTKPLGLIYTVPLHQTDPCWDEFTRQMSIWLAQQVNTAIPIFVRGNAFSTNEPGTGHFLQVSALYPLSLIPCRRSIPIHRGQHGSPERLAVS